MLSSLRNYLHAKIFFLIGIYSMKAVQPLQSMELQEKEAQKG